MAKISNLEMVALLAYYKDTMKDYNRGVSASCTAQALEHMRDSMGEDACNTLDSMTELRLFHTLKEQGYHMTHILDDLGHGKSITDLPSDAPMEARREFQMARDVSKYCMLSSTKLGIFLPLPYERFIMTNECINQFSRWLTWWDTWEAALMADELAVAVVSANMNVTIDSHIKPPGKWEDVKIEDMIKFNLQ